VVGNRGEVVTR